MIDRKLRFRFFAHSWVSDWNHGNAHFLRGLARELVRMGHEVRCYEELGSWSLTNLVKEGETAVRAIDDFRRIYPELNISFYHRHEGFAQFLSEELKGADVVVLHEWNDSVIIESVLEFKKRYRFCALLHDTHHRAYSNAGEILAFPMSKFDGVLAFGEAIRKIYTDGFGIARAWTFHEAADTSVFKPLNVERQPQVAWIGNWGDEERTRELEEFFVGPARALRGSECRFIAHGVRYPQSALETLKEAGIEYRGYLPNLSAPGVYSQSALTLHIPRRQYTNGLSGIPTIRVFEALACGIPLVCSPWTDLESLFRPGQDYVVVHSGTQMKHAIQELISDPTARQQIADSGLETIRTKHTCAHRAQQLVGIYEELRA